MKNCRNTAILAPVLMVAALALSGLGCSFNRTVQIRYGGAIEDVASVTPAAYEAYLAGQLAVERGDDSTALAQFETALGHDPDSVYLHVRLAELHVRRGRSHQAHRHLDQALRLDGDHPEALVLLGRMRWHEGRAAAAEAALRRCIAKNPRFAAAYVIRAELLERQDRPAEARSVLEAMVSRVRSVPEAHSNLAMLCLRQMDYTCAARHLELVLAQQADPDTLVRLAHVHRSRGDLASAVRFLREAFDRSGGNTGVASTLVEVLEQMGNRQGVDDLLAILEGDAEEDPEHVGVLAGLYLEARRPERALRLLEAQLKRGPSGVLHVQEAEALARVGRAKQAKELLRKELGGSNAPLAATELARVLQREGAYADASEILRQALRRHPDNDALILALSSALHLEGKPEASVQVLHEIVARRPGDRGLLFGLGAAQERAGQWRQAIETMRQILRRNPKDAAASNFVGYTLVEHGEDLKAAERFIRQALFVSPGEGYIVDSLGWLYYRQGRLAEAKRLLEMAVRLAPREPEVLAHLAEIEAARSDLSGALRLLRQAVTVSEDAQLTAKLRKRLHELEKGRVGAR